MTTLLDDVRRIGLEIARQHALNDSKWRRLMDEVDRLEELAADPNLSERSVDAVRRWLEHIQEEAAE